MLPATSRIEHRTFRDLGEYLRPGDLLVANDSRVIPARLHGRKRTGGAVEIFLLRPRDDEERLWEVLVRGRGLQPGIDITLVGETREGELATPALHAEIVEVLSSGARLVRFSEPIRPYLDELGEIPLPPYITQYAGTASATRQSTAALRAARRPPPPASTSRPSSSWRCATAASNSTR